MVSAVPVLPQIPNSLYELFLHLITHWSLSIRALMWRSDLMKLPRGSPEIMQHCVCATRVTLESGSKVLFLSVNSLKWLGEFSGINGVQSNWCYSLVPEKGKLSVCFYGDFREKKKKKLAYCFLCVKYNKCKVVLHCWLVFYERE